MNELNKSSKYHEQDIASQNDNHSQTPSEVAILLIKKILLGVKSTFEMFGEHHPIKLGVNLLALKALLAKTQIWSF